MRRAMPLLFAVVLLSPVLLLAPGLGRSEEPAEATPEGAAANAANAAYPPNVQVTTANGPANEVHIAVNPTNPLNLIAGAKDYTLGASTDCGVTRVWAGYYWSLDGGQSWGNGLMPGYPGGPPSPLTGYGCSSDPVVAFDGDGNAYYFGLALTPGHAVSALWLAVSQDGGATWPLMAKVAEVPGAGLILNDKNWFAIDPVTNVVHLVWAFFDPVGIHIVTAQCVLVVCGPPVPVSGLLPDIVQFSSIAVGPEGEVHLIWYDLGSRQLMYVRSDTQGAVWSQPKAIATTQPIGQQPNGSFRSPPMPQVIVDRSNGAHRGDVYVVFPDRRNDASDVMFVKSTDGGATWTSPARINDDPFGKSNFMPAIDVAPNGRVDVAFYDRRDDPANRLLTVYLASSADGGATWTNQRVSSAQFDGNLGRHQGGFAFIGDYIGIASTDAMAFPLWADTRSGTSQVMVGLVPR